MKEARGKDVYPEDAEDLIVSVHFACGSETYAASS